MLLQYTIKEVTTMYDECYDVDPIVYEEAVRRNTDDPCTGDDIFKNPFDEYDGVDELDFDEF
ncbi:MAG: hypothetical protein GWN01_14595 [Nitrosopumilaceae archaeon]|nr:hypothetical protein [Nitrosopumilaceae archaeon]NIX62686.1 hypothetical protein [Nitrosopumilaceae archaeon]